MISKTDTKTAFAVLKMSLKRATNQSEGIFPRESVWSWYYRIEYVNMLDNTKLNITLVMVADYQLQSLDGTRRILLAGSLTAYYRQPLIIS